HMSNDQPFGVFFSTNYQRLREQSPMRWMERVFDEIVAGRYPRLVDLPTGAGKTELVVIMAARGFSSPSSSGLGGIIAERIERMALISLTDIASIYCCKSTIDAEKDSGKETENKSADAEKGSEKEAGSGAAKPDAELTNAARRYLLALALLVENYPRSTGSYRLRSGCELLAAAKKEEVLGAGSDSEHAKALIGLCGDRELLIKVAQAAHDKLRIPAKLEPFDSKKEDLRGDLEKTGKKAGKQNKGSGGKGGKSKGVADAKIGAETDSRVESPPASKEIP